MLKNKLKINDEKTEFRLIASPHSQSEIKTDHHLEVENASIPISSSARNLRPETQSDDNGETCYKCL